MAKHPTYEQIMAMPLPQQALAMEERRHRGRLLEIKDMAAALALLEADLPAIKAAGANICIEHTYPVFRERLRLSLGGMSVAQERALCRALLLTGFKFVGRDDYELANAYFKKGRLTVRVMTRLADLEQAHREAAAALAAPAEATA
ncbi:hypothetical protein [Cupriavidus malaysiensis]|uniref:Uncharacterized protein n=1 Tax=Cupriavidus malaysiensis TaxID=367825 RepID=A0ABN4TKB7_9BURK|nr:hypothetical protein [Cupriavidus malaysiensis]AOZ05945.1 hypothetical protein BKK80_08985 [Cupriavidus malaysiensis]